MIVFPWLRGVGLETQAPYLRFEVGVEALDVLEGVGTVFEDVHGAFVDLAIEAGVLGIGGHDLTVPAGEVGGLDAGAVEGTCGVRSGLEFSDDGGIEVGRDFVFESEGPEGGVDEEARVVYTSFGASEDVLDENARRFLINASFWAMGLEDKITADLDASIVGKFQPAPYTTGSFYRAGVKPSDLAGWDSQVMPADAKYTGFDGKVNKRAMNVLKNRPYALKDIQRLHPNFKP